MNILNQISEQRIQAAMQKGDFDNLPGSGKPIQWDENLLAPADKKLAFDLLQNNGFTLPWIEKGTELRESIACFRQALRDWKGYGTSENELPAALMTMLQEVNRKIFDYNNSVPVDNLQVSFIDANRELNSISNTKPDMENSG